MMIDFDMWVILAVLVSSYVFVFGFLRNVNKWISFVKLGKKSYSNLPTGDLGWPFIGTSISFLKAFTNGDPDSYLHHIVSRNSERGIYKTHLFGRPTILVTEAEACIGILGNDDQFPSSYPIAFKKLLSKNRTVYETLTIELHKPLHRLTSALMRGSEALSLQLQYIEDNVVNALEEWATIKTPIELSIEMKALTLKIICQLFFGSTIDPHLGRLHELYRDFSAGVFSIFPWELPGSTFYRAVKAREKIVKIIKVIMEEIKEKGKNMEGEKERKGLLRMVMEARNENGGKLLEGELVIDHILMFVLGGEETTACASVWAMSYLTQNPQIFKKAKEEQELIVKKRLSSQKRLSFEETKQMKYLTMVINETLRVTTIPFASFREAKVDTSFNGYTFPKGWKIAVWYRGIHLNPHTYPNPQKFDPSRWENYVSKRGKFLPFGYGLRYCCGSELANLEITIILHHFLLYYKLELLNPECKATHLPLPTAANNCLSKITKLV